MRVGLATALASWLRTASIAFFQRPDEAINRGFDNQAEQDLSSPYTFLSNYEALPAERARDFVSNTVEFFDFTAPMREFISGVADSPDGPNYFALGTHPRVLDDGTRTKNPRYLQLRPDLSRPAGPLYGRNGRTVEEPARSG